MLRTAQRVGLLILLLLLHAKSYCGETNNYTYNFRQIGSGIYQVSNSHLSPLAFQGSGITLISGKNHNWNKQLSTSTFQLNLCYFGHPNKTSSMNGGDIGYSYLRYFKANLTVAKGTDIYVGGGYSGSLDILNKSSNINNALFYSLSNSLTIACFIGKKWDDYFLSNEFSIPLLGVYSTSEYASSFPYTFFENDISFLSKADLGSFNLNSIFRNSFNFDVIAHTKYKAYNLRFNYTIIYGRQKINHIKHVKAYHQFGIGFLFNTKHHEY